MSRCFRFPPPGYEREHIPEELILLKEAKHKEKKEKKEKKDKDRKKEKEKKEKDGSEKRDKKDRKEKHKDKKEKHGDKKKDKEDRGKDKEKSIISDESTVAGKLEERGGEKLHPEGHNRHSSVEDEGKCSTVFQSQNGKKPLQSILPSEATKEARHVQELDRRIRDDEKGRESQFIPRVANTSKREQDTAAGNAMFNPSQVLAEEKHSVGDNSFQGKKIELQGCNGEFIGKATVQNLTQVVKSKNGGIHRSLEGHNGSRLEDKEKYKETSGVKEGEKRKDKDKKTHGKDKHKDKEKEKRKEEKKKKKKEEEEKVVLAGAACNKSVNLSKDVVGTAPSEGSMIKRKEMDTNGFLHESEMRPNKVQRLALHQSAENGRKLEAFSEPSSGKPALPNNVRLDHHGQSNNGITEAKRPSPSRPNPSGTTIPVPPNTVHPDFSNTNEALRLHKKKDHHHTSESSKRPPHPDSKYLSQILTVPTAGDWSEDNDQEWLFSNKDPPNKPEPVGLKEEVQVWSEAVHIDSADVCALPYVIPY